MAGAHSQVAASLQHTNKVKGVRDRAAAPARLRCVSDASPLTTSNIMKRKGVHLASPWAGACPCPSLEAACQLAADAPTALAGPSQAAINPKQQVMQTNHSDRHVFQWLLTLSSTASIQHAASSSLCQGSRAHQRHRRPCVLCKVHDLVIDRALRLRLLKLHVVITHIGLRASPTPQLHVLHAPF